MLLHVLKTSKNYISKKTKQKNYIKSKPHANLPSYFLQINLHPKLAIHFLTLISIN